MHRLSMGRGVQAGIHVVLGVYWGKIGRRLGSRTDSCPPRSSTAASELKLLCGCPRLEQARKTATHPTQSHALTHRFTDMAPRSPLPLGHRSSTQASTVFQVVRSTAGTNRTAGVRAGWTVSQAKLAGLHQGQPSAHSATPTGSSHRARVLLRPKPSLRPVSSAAVRNSLVLQKPHGKKRREREGGSLLASIALGL